ncbi:MAG: nickel pincer cofactor biosynthesis protein LarB [Thermoplasmata archaeon]
MRKILEDLKNGKISIEDAEKLLTEKVLAIGEYVNYDLFRRERTGIPEVILGDTKEEETLLEIVKKNLEVLGYAIVSRCSQKFAEKLGRETGGVYYEKGRVFYAGKIQPENQIEGLVGIITGGTGDLRVAEEARAILEILGCRTKIAYDAGVAGPHRIVQVLQEMKDVDCYIVVAGREGTLPTLVASLVNKVVIGVPVSLGYGHGGSGEAALSTMLQSCSPVCVVNIDAGFTAALISYLIVKQISEARKWQKSS